MAIDYQKIGKLAELIKISKPDNLGDVFAQAVEIRYELDDMSKSLAEIPLTELRKLASQAEIGWKLFLKPHLPTHLLSDIEILQLINVERALHELCYCCERIEETASLTWGGSSPTRFYFNSIYYYVSSMFLIDKSKKSHKKLSMGGTVIRAFNPAGLSSLLDPIDQVLKQPLAGDFTFGETILLLRHSHLVHGDFSPKRFEYLVAQTEMRDPKQQERLAASVWDLFYQLLLLDLRLIAVLTAIDVHVPELVIRYLESVKKTNKQPTDELHPTRRYF
jgi:hypothetical protein